MARKKRRMYCVKAGKRTLKCFRKKARAMAYAKSRRKRGLKARVTKKGR